MEPVIKQKRIYGPCINIRLLFEFLMHAADIRAAKKAGTVSEAFENRIMLAVTQVNGCVMCAYYHTEHALKLGMSEAEVARIFDGEFGDAPQEQLTALLFAQHYAETTGKPGREALQRLAERYGRERAAHITAFVRAIMVGNAQGNIWGAVKARFAGKPEPGSSVRKELGVLAADVFVLPFVVLISLIWRPIHAILWCAGAVEEKDLDENP